jgi:hypothetical protein
MDRLKLTLAGCGLSLVLAAPGCRSTRSEVPPHRPYSSDGKQMPPTIGFSSDPHPLTGGAAMNPGASGMPGSPQFGTPPPSVAGAGAPTIGSYGAPGTSGGASGLTAPPGGFNDVLSARASAAGPGASGDAATAAPGSPGAAPGSPGGAANSTYYTPRPAASNDPSTQGYYTPGETGPMFGPPPK